MRSKATRYYKLTSSTSASTFHHDRWNLSRDNCVSKRRLSNERINEARLFHLPSQSPCLASLAFTALLTLCFLTPTNSLHLKSSTSVQQLPLILFHPTRLLPSACPGLPHTTIFIARGREKKRAESHRSAKNGQRTCIDSAVCKGRDRPVLPR